MRLMPRRSIHSTSGLKVPAKTRATVSSRTIARSCKNNQTPTIVARIHAIERGEISQRTTVGSFTYRPRRPGLPGVPPRSSFEPWRWFELPGSQPSGPLPTPWLHLSLSLSLPSFPARRLSHPTAAVPVNVTSPTPAAPAQALPLKVPPVMVIAAPARMLPWKAEVVIVAAASTHHVTLHGCAPPASTTEKLVPVSAPNGTLMSQVAFEPPLSVNTPVFASALMQ